MRPSRPRARPATSIGEEPLVRAHDVAHEQPVVTVDRALEQVERLFRAARRLRVDLEVVDVPSNEARDLYDAPLALIRPDQVVTWRGLGDADADAVFAVATSGAPRTRRGGRHDD